ncbi:hypothetical protein F5Y19DRAFT_408260 [Xylariaceae sp. FL1651]|nr:hypothetical protein F5Y19DRAFT_408260 [Xylariaceae sp. FL1651]
MLKHLMKLVLYFSVADGIFGSNLGGTGSPIKAWFMYYVTCQALTHLVRIIQYMDTCRKSAATQPRQHLKSDQRRHLTLSVLHIANRDVVQM